MGYKESRRRCIRSRPARSGKDCPGNSLKSEVCSDFNKNDDTCPSTLYSLGSYANAMCGDWIGLKTVAAKFEGSGRQGEEDPDHTNNACLIECKLKGSYGYASPVKELAGTGESPYFPDGVPCAPGKYCVEHRCVRPNTRSGRNDNNGPVEEISSGAHKDSDQEEMDGEVMTEDL